MKVKISILFLGLFLTCGNVMADTLEIPFSCWPQELKEEFKKRGLKLDLNSSERTNESWGYIKNEGSRYVLFTYNSVTSENFQVIQDIVFKIELKERK